MVGALPILDKIFKEAVNDSRSGCGDDRDLNVGGMVIGVENI